MGEQSVGVFPSPVELCVSIEKRRWKQLISKTKGFDAVTWLFFHMHPYGGVSLKCHRNTFFRMDVEPFCIDIMKSVEQLVGAPLQEKGEMAR